MNKIDQLKKIISTYPIQGYIVPKNDSYFNEFVNADKDRLKFISNFSGSFGYALILENQNYLFVDGRYTLQAKNESGQNFQIVDITKHSIHNFIKKINIKIGFDPSLFKYSWVKTNNHLIPIQENLIDKIWKRNSSQTHKAFVLSDNFTGEKHDTKINKIKTILQINKTKVYFIHKNENVCWLLNIRGQDNNFTPILNSHALITSKQILIFCNLNKISADIKKFYGNKIKFLDENKIIHELNKFKKSIIGIDTDASYKIIDFLKKNKFKIQFQKDPIFHLKSKKNNTEIVNSKLAHLYDGISVTKFICWLQNQKKLSKINEIIAQNKLENFRKRNKSYLFASFPTISGFCKHGAIIHYRASQQTNLKFTNNNLYLIDSGAQYREGTTDITRTILFGKATSFQRKIYTKVLQGHIAVHEFKLNNQTKGKEIDKAARKFLKKINLDYEHGTGHGVGYFLNVHENPPSISRFSEQKFYHGQIISNEPGFYKKNYFGIRIENLIYVENHKSKYRFSNLTLVPYEKKLINKNLLSKKEINYINNYHQQVFTSLKPFMNQNELRFLEKQCLPI